MSLPTIEIGVALGVPADDDFIIGDITRGVIGSTVYTLSADYTIVTPDSYAVSISRGRFSRLWDAVDAGRCTVNVFNMDRDYDPAHMGSPFAGYIVPGRGVQVKANDLDIWTGFVDDWNLEYDPSGISTASLVSTDALGVLGQLQFDDWTSSSTWAGNKLDDVCDRPEVQWPSTLRTFDVGVEPLQADTVTWGSNVLNYAQLIARSELGYFYADASGLLTFRDRNVAVAATPAASFDDGTSTGTPYGGAPLRDGDDEILTGDDGEPLLGDPEFIAYNGLSATIGSELLFARVGVDREGGINQTATVTDVDVWQATYGPQRSLSVSGLLLDTDTQSLSLAEYLLALYDTPRYRISDLRVDLTGLTDDKQTVVLGIDITDTVTVAYTPNSVGDPIMQSLVVQGIRHDISVSRHVVTLSLIDAPFPYFRIGDAEYGVIGDDLIGF